MYNIINIFCVDGSIMDKINHCIDIKQLKIPDTYFYKDEYIRKTQINNLIRDINVNIKSVYQSVYKDGIRSNMYKFNCVLDSLRKIKDILFDSTYKYLYDYCAIGPELIKNNRYRGIRYVYMESIHMYYFLLYVKYNIVMELCNRINTVEVFEVIYTHIKMGMLTKDIFMEQIISIYNDIIKNININDVWNKWVKVSSDLYSICPKDFIDHNINIIIETPTDRSTKHNDQVDILNKTILSKFISNIHSNYNNLNDMKFMEFNKDNSFKIIKVNDINNLDINDICEKIKGEMQNEKE